MTEIISGLVTGMPMLANETNQTSSEGSLVTSCSEGDLVIDTGLGTCYLHVIDTPIDKLRMAGEVVLVVMSVYFILKVYITISLNSASAPHQVIVCIDLINHNDDPRLCTSSPSLVGGFSCRTWFFALQGSPSSSPVSLFRSTKHHQGCTEIFGNAITSYNVGRSLRFSSVTDLPPLSLFLPL